MVLGTIGVFSTVTLKVFRTYGIGFLRERAGGLPMLGGWPASPKRFVHYILLERQILSTRIIKPQVIGEQQVVFTYRVAIINIKFIEVDT